MAKYKLRTLTFQARAAPGDVLNSATPEPQAASSGSRKQQAQKRFDNEA